MLPCFCRSLEVMTAGGEGCHSGDAGPWWVPETLPPSTTHRAREAGAACPTPLPITRPGPPTFTKCDAVQVAALEEAGLDGAGLWGEQPVLPWPGSALAHGCCVPAPTLPGCPPARHLGDGVHPVVPLHQLVFRRHPVLPFPHPCGEARRWLSPPGRQHPWVTQGHMPQTGMATPHAPALRPNPGNPPNCAQQLSEPGKRQGFTSLAGKRPAQVGRPRDAARSRVAPPAGATPNLPGPMQGAGPGAQAAPYLSIQRKYWRWGSDRCPCHRLLRAACRETPG